MLPAQYLLQTSNTSVLWATKWFPGYKYIYTYNNSLNHIQYQKLITIPPGIAFTSTNDLTEDSTKNAPFAATHLDVNDSINLLYPDDIITDAVLIKQMQTPYKILSMDDVLNNGLYGKDTITNLATIFNTSQLPSYTFKTTNNFLQKQYYYSYISLWGVTDTTTNTPIYNITDTALLNYMSNYIPTTWFPGYNYIYLYKNAAGRAQYQKLISRPQTVALISTFTYHNVKSYSTITFIGNFNEKLYLNSNTDVVGIINNANSGIKSGYAHWCNIGYMESRNGTAMKLATDNNNPILNTLDIVANDYKIMPIATTYIDVNDSINKLFQHDTLDFSSTSNAIKNCVYGTNAADSTTEFISNIFFPLNGALGSPFKRFNITDILSQYKFYYAYYASCVLLPPPIPNPLNLLNTYRYSILDTVDGVTNVGKYYATSWFPGFNYIFTYKNSAGHMQYQKLISLPSSLPSGTVITQLVSCDLIANSTYAITHLDSNDTINLSMQDEQLPTGMITNAKKSFFVGLNLLDCTYNYGMVSNTGYFIQDNTPVVPDTNSDISGFQYIPVVFTTFMDKVKSLIPSLTTQATTVATQMSNAYSNASTTTTTSYNNLGIALPRADVVLSLDNSDPNLVTSIILTFHPTYETGYTIAYYNTTTSGSMSTIRLNITISSLINNKYIISDINPGIYKFIIWANNLENKLSIGEIMYITVASRAKPTVSVQKTGSTARFTFNNHTYETYYIITYKLGSTVLPQIIIPSSSPNIANTTTTYDLTGLTTGAYTYKVYSGTSAGVILSLPAALSSSGFEDYVRPNEYKVKHILIESNNPFSVPIQIYDMNDVPIAYNATQRDNGILLELYTITEIAGFSFVPGKYDPVDWSIKGTKNGKDWIFNHKYKFNKYIDQSPLFYFNGSIKNIKAPKQEIQETPKFDVKALQKYYKQKINPSIIPEYKKYMYAHDVVYFLYDEYDLNKKLIATDLVIGYVLKEGKVKKSILYEDEDGNYSGFDLSKKAVQRFWDKHIMVELNFASPVIF